jgi:hypothetical protein
MNRLFEQVIRVQFERFGIGAISVLGRHLSHRGTGDEHGAQCNAEIDEFKGFDHGRN